MSFKFTNKYNISLALAVFLIDDQYDYDDRPNSVSATGLIRPLRQLVLSMQNKTLQKEVDISDLVASRMGTAIHDGCEKAWSNRNNIAQALEILGASENAIDRLVINPQSTVDEDQIPIYVEQRTEKEIDEYIITGKYDLILYGILNDYKSTSTYNYIFDSSATNSLSQIGRAHV